MKDGNNKYEIELTLIARYLSGEADNEEISRLELWRSESEENNRKFEDFRIVWNKTAASGLFTDVNIDTEWGHFKDRINIKPHIQENRKSSVFTGFMKIAAILVLGMVLSISSFYVYNRMKFEKIVAGTEMKQIVLPDRSKLSLYPGSSIEYPRHFNSDIRQIKLEGEAFFEVSRDTLHPFQVEAGKMNVQVLGTSFLVRAEKKAVNMEVIVESGKVRTYLKDKPDEMKILLPGDKLTYKVNQDELIKSKNTDLNYNAWKTGIISFENASLKEVADVLSKTFNVNLRAEADGNCHITVGFKGEDLNYILETLKATLDINIVKRSDEIVLVSQDC